MVQTPLFEMAKLRQGVMKKPGAMLVNVKELIVLLVLSCVKIFDGMGEAAASGGTQAWFNEFC